MSVCKQGKRSAVFPPYQQLMDSPQGWPYILRQFETAVS